MGLNWTHQIKPELKNDPEFREAMDEYLDEFRYQIVHSIMEAGSGLRPKNAGALSIPLAREALALIDSGLILDSEETKQMSPEELQAHSERLGLIETEE